MNEEMMSVHELHSRTNVPDRGQCDNDEIERLVKLLKVRAAQFHCLGVGRGFVHDEQRCARKLDSHNDRGTPEHVLKHASGDHDDLRGRGAELDCAHGDIA